jgi:predicted DNA-binding transcriptional regulator AlpA
MQTELREVLERLERIEARLAVPAPAKEFLSVEEAAEFTGLSKVLLDEWRSRGGNGPAYHKLGRRVLYSVTDLRSFAAQSRVEALK